MLALLFPGQGSQRPHMGVPWNHHPTWEVVERVSDASGRDVAHLLTKADAHTLRATKNAQLAAFALSLVVLDALRHGGHVLDHNPALAAAGHSLGEYTALVAAGALTVEEGSRLVAARAEAMQAAADANPGTMAAVLGLDPEGVAEACGAVENVWPANDNAPGQVVVAGTHDGVEAAGEAARKAGAKRVMPLEVGGAFHSPLMAPAQGPLDEALHEARFDDARLDVVTNIDASAHRDGWTDLLSSQLVSPVRWRESLLTLSNAGVTHFLEIGGGSELSGMVKRTVEGSARYHVAAPHDLAGLQHWLSQTP